MARYENENTSGLLLPAQDEVITQYIDKTGNLGQEHSAVAKITRVTDKENQKEICAVMETHTAAELPVLYALAKNYAVCDLWFSSVPTQTNPNRAFGS